MFPSTAFSGGKYGSVCTCDAVAGLDSVTFTSPSSSADARVAGTSAGASAAPSQPTSSRGSTQLPIAM